MSVFFGIGPMGKGCWSAIFRTARRWPGRRLGWVAGLFLVAAAGFAGCDDTVDGLVISGARFVEVAETAQLTATLHQGHSSENVTTTSLWLSQDEDFATVGGTTGLVTGIDEGQATISNYYSGFQADFTITVTDTNTGTLVLTPDPVAVAVGSTRQLTATHSEDGDVTALAVWQSSNLGVASVDDAGLVMGLALGTSDITATYNTVSATVTVQVSAAP